MTAEHGWLSPWALLNNETGVYEIRDYHVGTKAPIWQFPAESGTVLLAGGAADLNGDIAASVDHSSGIILNNRVYNDYGTLVSSQAYKAGYYRYNVRSTTPGNPVAEVTGLEGVAASYINDEALTFRGGYFRTYINADATSTMRTAIGCEISARASQNGGTQCVAEAGTAFVGARIWMAPFFTAGSIGNINNFHALWILNEAAGKFVTNAIKIDATTYGSGFVYSFNTDSGKFRLLMDGSVAGSGLVAGETSTASGDDIMYVRAEDYRTLTSSQVYRAGYFRYNVRSTTPSNPTCEVTGIEGVAGSYIADEAMTFRGGYFRTYINADSTSTMRTAIGCEISARASQPGATACVAEAGTCFTGARIWMAPWFSAGSVNNINNFWGLWIYGEHTSQRNADAAILISDAGGGFAAGLNMTFKLYISGKDNCYIGNGTYTHPLTIDLSALTAADRFFAFQQFLTFTKNAAGATFAMGFYPKILVNGEAQTNVRFAVLSPTITIEKNVKTVYGVKSELDISHADVTAITDNCYAISGYINLGSETKNLDVSGCCGIAPLIGNVDGGAHLTLIGAVSRIFGAIANIYTGAKATGGLLVRVDGTGTLTDSLLVLEQVTQATVPTAITFTDGGAGVWVVSASHTTPAHDIKINVNGAPEYIKSYT